MLRTSEPTSCCQPQAVRSSLQPAASSWMRVVVCALVLVLGPVSEAWGFGFSVEPARVKVSVPAGKRRGETLTVRNVRETPIHLTIYVRDVIYLPDGTHEFPPPGSTDWSAATWLRITPEELEIPAQGTRDVRLSVLAPPDATGGRYAIAFFETGASYAEEGIGVNFRVGALVEAVVPNTEQYAARLNDLVVVSPSEIRADVFNEGNVLIRPKGRVKVFDAAGHTVRELPFNHRWVGVLPKTLRKFSTTLEEPLPEGSYRVRVEMDYGVRTLIVGEHTFEVP